MRVLLGGGIGSGKSAVASLFAARGAVVIDSDRLGHQVLEPGAEAFDAVSARWPQVVVDDRFDRAKLASIVFGDAGSLAELEAISHPAIVRRIQAEAEAAGETAVFVEVPVMLPMHRVRHGDDPGATWVHVFVDAPEEVRLERAIARGGDAEDIRRRMRSQDDRQRWLSWAAHVIVNDGSRTTLERAVDELWDDLTRGSG